MDAELKTKWIAALKGGDYRQGRGVLHRPNDNSFCCLGVLCAIKGGTFVSKPKPGYMVNGVFVENMSSARDIYNLLSLMDPDTIGRLMDMNDGISYSENGSEYTFSEIADWIKENVRADAQN